MGLPTERIGNESLRPQAYSSIEVFAKRRFNLLASVLAVLSGVLVVIGARHSWFASDDFRNLGEGIEQGLNLDFLLAPIIGFRFEPGHRLVDWLVIQAPGAEWEVALTISSVSVVAATFTTAHLARQLSGSASLALVTAAAFGLWVGWTRIAMWWANAAQTLPAIALSIASVAIAVLWYRNRSTTSYLLALLLLLGALCFSIRATLVPAIASIVFALGSENSKSISFGDVIRGLRRGLALLIPMGLISLAFVVVELSSNNALSNPLPNPTVWEWLKFMAVWMTKGLGAVVTNGLPNASEKLDPRSAAGLLLLASLAAATIRGFRSASIWAAALLLVLASGIQVATYRLPQLGLGVVDVLYYHEGVVMVLAALVPLAWRTAGGPIPTSTLSQTAIAIGGVVAATLLLSGWVTSLSQLRSGKAPATQDITQAQKAKAGIERLRRSTAQATRSLRTSEFALIEDETPYAFSPFGDRNLPRIFRVFVRDARVSLLGATGATVVVADDGTLVRALTSDKKSIAPERTCLESTTDSKLVGPGSFGISIRVPKNRRDSASLLRFKLDVKRPGDLGIALQPSRSGLPEYEIFQGGGAGEVRVLVPPGKESVSVLGWNGLTACIGPTSSFRISESSSWD